MTEVANPTQKVLTLTGILQFAYLASPFQSKQDDGKVRLVYKTSVLFDRNDPQTELIRAATREVAKAAWGDKPTLATGPDGNQVQVPEWQAILMRFAATAADKLAIRDGNFAKDEAYKGKFYITANAKKQPTVVATLGNPPANVKLEPGHIFYPGSTDKCAVMVAIYAQNPKGGKQTTWGERINVQLMGVQFLEKGEGLSGGGRVAQVQEFGINPVAADAVIPMSQADVGTGAGGLI